MAQTKKRRAKATPPPVDVPRHADDKGYYRGLGYLLAGDLNAIAGRKHTAKERNAVLAAYGKLDSKQSLDAIRFVLDPVGERSVDPTDWIPFRAVEGWVFFQRSRLEAGAVLIADSGNVALLDRTIPHPIKIQRVVRDSLPLKRSSGSLSIASSNDALPVLTKPQHAILEVLREPGVYDRQSLASKIDVDGEGVNEQTIYRAMNDKKDGLKVRGLVSHTRRTGYVLTEMGRALAEKHFS